MKRLALHSRMVCLLILVALYVWSLQLLQLYGEDKRYFSTHGGRVLSWGAQETPSGLNGEGSFQSAFHPFVVKRITRLSQLLRPIFQVNYTFTLTRAVETVSIAHSFFCGGQDGFCTHPIDLGIGARKIPTPENTDELPTPRLV